MGQGRERCKPNPSFVYETGHFLGWGFAEGGKVFAVRCTSPDAPIFDITRLEAEANPDATGRGEPGLAHCDLLGIRQVDGSTASTAKTPHKGGKQMVGGRNF